MFADQVSTDNLLMAFIYTVGAVFVLFVVLGLGFIDAGLVRHRNVLDTWVQKFTAAIIGGFATLLFGYAIWQWQFYQAFGIPTPFIQAIKDWWIGGPDSGTASIFLNSTNVPNADTQQVFLVFFVTFTMATMALIHSSAVERVKGTPFYVMAAVIGLVLSPLVGLLCWGPLSPLTNSGLHDFEGVFPLYIFSGTWSLILAWRLGPRRGAFGPDSKGLKPTPGNFSLVAVGVMLIIIAIPFIALGSTWIIPGKGVYGISFTQTGIGLILINMFCALLTGGVVGSIIAHLRKEVPWLFFGPIAGAVMSGTLFDIGTPIQCMIFGALGPIIALITSKIVISLKIDEPKVVPLAFGPGIAGAILVGFVRWGTPTGGFAGLTAPYALGHAQITPLWQLAGVVATMLISGIPALVLCRVFEKTSGLRISEETEFGGLDKATWGVANMADDLSDGGLRISKETEFGGLDKATWGVANMTDDLSND
jgi:ammonium transporter, Amt family